MGNQQERLDIKAAQLAMLWDTEGSLSVRVIQRGHNRLANIAPIALVVNTQMDLMEWACQTLKDFSIPFFVQDIKPYASARMRRPQRRITITGMKRVQKLFSVIAPYLIGKRKQMELMVEYMDSRMSKWHRLPYTDRELQITNEIRALNSNKCGGWRPESSETLRAARQLQEHMNGMIKSALHGDMQSTAETTVLST